MTLYLDKYRVESARRQAWDYSLPGWYFVTICVAHRKCLLSDIRGAEVILAAVGKAAERAWREIPSHYAGVDLDAHVIMPNHVHGIVVLTEAAQGPQRTLGNVVGSFKSAITRWSRVHGIGFHWQERFYDQILTTNASIAGVREYIASNPINWPNDQFFVAPTETGHAPSLRVNA